MYLHVLNGIWTGIDKFDMILAYNMYGLVGYKNGINYDSILVDGTRCWCGQDVIQRLFRGGASFGQDVIP